MGLSLKEFSDTIDSLQESLLLYHSSKSKKSEQKAFRDACIQRFEYSIELSWKVSMKVLGTTTAAAKPAIREMVRNNLINDPNLWIGFIEARNNTAHSYDEKVAEKVFTQVELFLPGALKLIETLKKVIK